VLLMKHSTLRIIVEPLDDCLSQLSFGVTVKSYVIELEHVQHFLENVKHLRHLRENQRFLASVLDGSEQKYQFDQFSAVVKHDVFIREMK
jgi:hypothetical protein